MRLLRSIAVCLAALALFSPLHAHRASGLLQSALVDVQPEQVEVQISLLLGQDIAARFAELLDTDHNGFFAENERTAWSEAFVHAQSIRLDGETLPLVLTRMQASPIAEMTSANQGHAEVRVIFAAKIAPLSVGSHRVEHENRYEPIPSTYQADGIVPKAPGIRIVSHRRDEREQTISLQAEWSPPPMAVEQSHAIGASFGAWWVLISFGIAGGMIQLWKHFQRHRSG